MPDILTLALLTYVTAMYAPASYFSYEVWKAGAFSRAWGLVLLGDVILPMAFWLLVIIARVAPSEAATGLELVLFVLMPTFLVLGLWQLWKVVRKLGACDDRPHS